MLSNLLTGDDPADLEPLASQPGSQQELFDNDKYLGEVWEPASSKSQRLVKLGVWLGRRWFITGSYVQ